MLSKSTSVLLILLLAVGGGVYWWTQRAASEDLEQPEDAYPPGRWSRVPAGADSADLTAVLSLPYLQGKIEAGEESGVVRFDPERAQPGINLYCSGHGPEAILMDMEGNTLHRWQLRFRKAFPKQPILQESAFFRRVALLDDGALLALFHGTGLVKLDRDSDLLWALPLAGFNDFFVEADGRILLLNKEARVIPDINPDEPVLEDQIVEISADGEILSRFSILAVFRQPPWDDLLAEMIPEGDILHSNTVTRLDTADRDGPFRDGNLLVSLREVSVLGVIDPELGEVVWGQRGDWRKQHEPVLLADGNLLVFDNQGGENHATRILEITPAGETAWSYGDAQGEGLWSPEGGTVARLANGNTLITASESGRALEITPQGDVAWEYLSPHRAGPNDQLVAAIWEMERVALERVDWLDRE